MSDDETAAAAALRSEYDRLEKAHAEADELPEEIDQRLGEIEAALAALEERPVKYDPDEIVRAGVFVSIDRSGALRIERGYVRPEDEPAVLEVRPDSDVGLDGIEAASQEGLRCRASARRRRMSVTKRRSRASSRSLIG